MEISQIVSDRNVYNLVTQRDQLTAQLAQVNQSIADLAVDPDTLVSMYNEYLAVLTAVGE